MNEFLDFRTMITPLIIKIIFWIGVSVSVLSGIGLIIAGSAASAEANRYGGGYGGGGGLPGGLLVLAGLIQIFVGPILVRISCELTILFFRIYETLTDLRSDGRAKAPAITPTYPQSTSTYPQSTSAYPQP